MNNLKSEIFEYTKQLKYIYNTAYIKMIVSEPYSLQNIII